MLKKMKANFILPQQSDDIFNKVRHLELPEQEAQTLVDKYNEDFKVWKRLSKTVFYFFNLELFDENSSSRFDFWSRSFLGETRHTTTPIERSLQRSL